MQRVIHRQAASHQLEVGGVFYERQAATGNFGFRRESARVKGSKMLGNGALCAAGDDVLVFASNSALSLLMVRRKHGACDLKMIHRRQRATKCAALHRAAQATLPSRRELRTQDRLRFEV